MKCELLIVTAEVVIVYAELASKSLSLFLLKVLQLLLVVSTDVYKETSNKTKRDSLIKIFHSFWKHTTNYKTTSKERKDLNNQLQGIHIFCFLFSFSKDSIGCWICMIRHWKQLNRVHDEHLSSAFFCR